MLRLVERARDRRHATSVDPAFRSYSAEAEGFVYFFLDRPESDERVRVKTDQIALELFWRAPDQTKQRIVGLRDEKSLPTNIKYHLDHLTVVQDEFADRIRLGDGDEVSDVIHPVGTDAEAVYDYRMGDSTTVTFPGRPDTIRVYQLRVRPKNPDLPGFVGSVYLDRETASIVSMDFTFTPASYVDPYLDYIRISLDNGLWMGRYWLPYRQEAELRRELPQLDFLAGSVIRGRFEIGGYTFNPDLPDHLFRTRRVSAVPEEQRESYPFERPIHAQLEEEGLATPAAMDDIRDQAREIMGDRYLSGLNPLRLHLASVSSAYRFNRAEGHFLGMGTSYTSEAVATVNAHAGYAFGRDDLAASLEVSTPVAPWLGMELYVNRLRDVGPVSGASGALNSLSGLVIDEDWLDPWFASGGSLRFRGPDDGTRLLSGGTPWATARLEHHDRAEKVVEEGDPDFRPVRPTEEGELLALEYGVTWGDGPDVTEGWGLRVGGTTARFEGVTFGGAELGAAWGRGAGWRDLDLQARLDAGWVGDDAPPQELMLLGGRETLLGYGFRSFVGDVFWLLRGEVGRTVWEPWLSVRGFASMGQAELTGRTVPPGWEDADPSGGVLYSVGGGVALLWEILHVDLGRGLDGGSWEAALSVTHRFRDWL